MKRLFEDKEIRIFAVIAMVIGIVMSFLISPWQIPDEVTHLQLISYYIENPEFASRITNSLGMDQGRIEWITSEKTDVEQMLYAMTKAPDYTISEMLPKGISLGVLKYIPAIIGMEFAIILQLPTFWVLQLGELMSLLVYVFICCWGLKVCPFKKHIMAIFMLSPMMMQQAGSYSYDALAIPLMFWIICYVLYLRYEKESIELKDVILLVLAWLVVTYLKVPYVMVVLLGLMLPLKKFHVKIGKTEIDETFIKRVRWPVLLAVIAIVAVGLYVFRNNLWVQVLYGVVAEFPRTIYLLYSTLRHFTGHLIVSSVGNFGWLSAPVSDIFGVAFYVIILVFAITLKDNSAKRLAKWDRGVIWVAFLSLTLLTVFSMINHTIMITLFGSESAPETYNIRQALYWIPYIGGLQGRYFMPFISLFFMQIGSIQLLNEKKTKIIVGLFVTVTYMYVIYILLNRYWIG